MEPRIPSRTTKPAISRAFIQSGRRDLNASVVLFQGVPLLLGDMRCAEIASHALRMEPGWNPGAERQILLRPRGLLGQDHPIAVDAKDDLVARLPSEPIARRHQHRHPTPAREADEESCPPSACSMPPSWRVASYRDAHVHICVARRAGTELVHADMAACDATPAPPLP
jgi:hypothetical protein